MAEQRRQENPDRIVAAYLRNRGFEQSEAAFRKEAKLVSDNLLEVGTSKENSVSDYILFYNESEASNPNAYERSYERLRRWVEDSIDKYKVELRRVLFPIFVHAYLDLIARGLRDPAKHFLDLFKSDHIELHGQDIQRLSAISEPHHITENDMAQNFRSNRYGVKMSRYSFELLVSFIQDNKYMLLLRILNEHVNISVTAIGPEATEDGLDLDSGPGLMGHAAAQLFGLNQTRLNLGQLPPDIQFLSEIERTIKEEAMPDAQELSEELKKVKVEPSDAPPMSLPPKKLIDVPAAIKALRETRARVQLGPSSLPSICCYTFHNTHGSLHSLALSPDATIVSAGFADSLIRLWNISGESITPSAASKGLIPKGAAPVNTRRLVGHSGPVYATSFSSDQRFLISCSEDKTARLWSMDTMTNVVCYKGHNYPVWDAEFSPQGWYFATASHDRTARLWSCDHIYPLRIFVGHLSDVDAVRFHPNGNYLLTGSSDCTARLWDVQKGSCVRLFQGHQGAVQAVAFSPDGRTLATAGEDHRVILWDAGSGRRLKVLSGHTAQVYTLDFSNDGTLLASGGADDTVRIWDVQKSESREIAIRDGVRIAPKGDALLGTYPTKRTPIYNLQFTRTNVLMALGAFNIE